MNDVIITVENLGKKYRLGQRSNERYTALRDVIANSVSAPFRRLRNGRRSKLEDGSSTLAPSSQLLASTTSPGRTKDFWALKDVSFEVRRGEVVGIIGRNGAGKSTLLKILSRITEPTEGRVTLKGRVASLLEVGTGFHPELTGRENIYLNGAILGMTKAEIKKKFDEIVDFAEIEKFLDTPVKRYSSGMYVRLAFAVAAHLEPEILVVDEVLAVGDAEFQKKCLGKMESVSRREGRTVLFVSHNMAAITKLCNRTLVIKAGILVFQGVSAEAARFYLGSQQGSTSEIDFTGRHDKSKGIEVVSGALKRDGISSDEFLFGDNIEIQVAVRPERAITFSVEFILRDEQGLPIAFSPGGLGLDSEFSLGPDGVRTIVCEILDAKLAQGSYSLDVILAETGVRFFDYIESAFRFRIADTAIAGRNWSFRQNRGQGSLLLAAKHTLL